MIRTTIYIGANNKTRKIREKDQEVIEEIVAIYWENFTITQHFGFYKKQKEESISVTIFSPGIIFDDVGECVKKLKRKFKQQTIMVSYEAGIDVKYL